MGQASVVLPAMCLPRGTPKYAATILYAMRGAYCLVIRLARASTIRVGCLGTFRFPRGTYVYTGSGLSGVEARVRRHLRRKKRMRWHIDYLLRVARVSGVIEVAAPRRIECEINRLVCAAPGARTVVPHFGSSDCSCPSHLAFWGSE